MRRLENRIERITSAAGGVGNALAGARAREGARVVVAGFDRARVAEAAVVIGDDDPAAIGRTGGTTVLLTVPAMATAQTG